MKTMTIEKKLLFDEAITAVKEVHARHELVYEQEADGSIRACGPLYLECIMVNAFGRDERFKEILDMDILAPYHKLTSEPFSIEVRDVEHHVEDDGIALVIHMDILGLCQEKKELSASVSIEEDVPLPETKKEIESEKTNLAEEFEDLFEDEETTYTSYRLVVAQNDDSYASIAARYQVEEGKLRQINREKELCAKALVVLPF